MSTTDNYLFNKSMEAQGEEKYTPYNELNWNYIPDSNNGVYQPSNCMVQWDLQNLYSSTKYIDCQMQYLAIPVTVVYALVTGSAVVPPGALNMNTLVSLKSNYANLIHSCDLVLDGKTINQSNAFTNVYTAIKMMSQLTPSDLDTMGASLGYSSVIDNHRSMKYVPSLASATTGAVNNCGTGLCNNVAFSGATLPSFDRYGVISAAGAITARTANRAIQEKIFRFPNCSGTASENGVYGSTGIVPLVQLNADLRPYYFQTSGNFGILYDVALIPLKYIYDSMANIGLTRKVSGTLKIYLNTGSIAISTGNTPATPAYSMNDLTYSSFVNSCPLTINYLGDGVALPATTTNIVAGLYVGRSVPSTTILGVNLSLAGASHALANCRLYFPQIEIDVNEAAKFNELNRTKKVVHRQFTVNTYNNITAGSSENRLVQAGIKNPLSVIIVPYLAAAPGSGATAGYVEQFRSPFDTFPNTLSPVQLSNLQVSVGGKNFLQNQLNYSFDVFLQQVNNHDSLGLSDIGINQGLFDAAFWELNRVYFIDVARSSASEKLTPRSIQVNFTNNSNVNINYMVFIEYLDEFTIDTLTGQVTINNQM